MTAVTPVGTYIDPDNTSQTGSTYKTSIDGAIRAGKRVTDRFAPRAVTSPNMTVVVDPGWLWNGTTQTLTETTSQTSGTITAPVSNPRIDRIVGDNTTGAISIVTGTPAGSPVAPAVPSGKFPIAQIALTTGTTSITDAIISDERAFPSSAAGTSGPVSVTGGSVIAAGNFTVVLPGSPAYAAYEVYLLFAVGTNNVQLAMGLTDDVGSSLTTQWSYLSGNSSTSSSSTQHGSASDAQLAQALNSAGGSLKMTINAPQGASQPITGVWQASWLDQGGAFTWHASGSFRSSLLVGSSYLNKLVFHASSGNITATVRVVGIP